MGLLKFVTAVVSVATVIALFRLMPQLLQLRGPAQLEREVVERTDALRRSENERRLAQERAESADRAKSAFVARMSHELRSPLTAILGNCELLLAEDHDADQVHACLEAIHRSAEHQLELVEDVLEISRIESGVVELAQERVDPAEALRAAVALVAHRADQKSLALRVDVSGVEHAVVADPLRVRQVLVNLLTNAIKFTERGEITASARTFAMDPEVAVEFAVADTGIGMTEQHLARVFEPYLQADPAVHGRFGGSGLGLAISRDLARAMGGDVVGTALPGRGSEFRFTLRGPCGASVAATTASGTDLVARDLAGKHVLLVEDQVEIAVVVRRQLELAGCLVTCVVLGATAIDAVRDGAFDLVLLDLQLPDMSGLAVHDALRRLGITTPVVALTAHGMAAVRDECLAAGFDDFATKPLRRTELLRLVERHVAREAAA